MKLATNTRRSGERRIGPAFVLGLLLVGMAGLAQSGSGARAEDMVRLSDADRAAYQAIGRVNLPGYRRVGTCSGTLIAPDLVLTAAHCVGSPRGANDGLHFVAGWHGGRYVAHRRSAFVAVHPMYDRTTGRDRFDFDIALIRLETPIPRAVVAPVPLLAADQLLPRDAILLGYARTRANTLSGAFGCPLLNVTRSSFLYGCEVVSGTSGGAVLVQTDDGPALAAVIAARVGKEGYGLAVPIKTWVRSNITEVRRASTDRP